MAERKERKTTDPSIYWREGEREREGETSDQFCRREARSYVINMLEAELQHN